MTLAKIYGRIPTSDECTYSPLTLMSFWINECLRLNDEATSWQPFVWPDPWLRLFYPWISELFEKPQCSALNWSEKHFNNLPCPIIHIYPVVCYRQGGGPRVVVSTAAFHARVRGSVPGLGGLKGTKSFFPIHVWKSVLWGASVTER